MNFLCHKYLNQNILPFVGREPELRRLRQRFREFLEEGESKYTLITGVSGSGKSRLVREFEEYLTQEFGDAAIIVHARYLEGNAAAVTPIVNAFGATLTHHENIKALLQRLKLVKPDIDQLGLGATSDPEPPPLQVLLDSLTEISKRFPLALILEDVHNIEDLPVFDQFFLGLSSAAKFVIFTERITEEEHGKSGTTEQFMREIALREERSPDVIPLDPLGKEDVRRFFQILFTIDPSEELIQRVEERTSGRPLSLRTMLRQLVTGGAIVYDKGEWQEDTESLTEAESERDDGSQETLVRFQRELERLNEQEQVVLHCAALLGEQFDLRLLRSLLRYQLGESDLSEDLFRRTIELLTFKSLIRRATPSIYFHAGAITSRDREELNGHCYEFSHQHFWNSVMDEVRDEIAGRHDLVLAIVSLAGDANIPLYSNAFLSSTGTSFSLLKSADTLSRIEYFLHWAAGVVKSLWSVEPQQSLRFLLSTRAIRDEVTWRFGPELSEEAMSSLLDLHSLLVEAFIRNGSLLEAERDLEHAAVLERFIQSSKTYTSVFQARARGKVATLRAILAATRTSYIDFGRWSDIAKEALSVTPDDDMERARLLTILTRTRAESLLNTGRFREADELIEAGMPTAQLLADSRFDEYCLYYRVAVTSKLKQDQNEQASELTNTIIQIAQQRGNTLVETTFLFQAALAAFSTGKLIEATRYCDLGILNGRRYGIRFVEIMSNLWRMIIAGVLLDAEKVKECSTQLSSLVEDARIVAQAPNLLQRISLIEGRATAMNFLGRPHAALEFAEEAIQLAGSHHHDSFAAWAQNEKALALVGLGRYEDAVHVAKACIEISGEQRTAARTAHTALLLAYVGLGKVAQATEEVELLRHEYNAENPHYLRFALGEARLLKLALARSESEREKASCRSKLQHKLSEIFAITDAWKANALQEYIHKEFDDLLPRKAKTLAKEIFDYDPTGEATASGTSARWRILTFGSMHVEAIDTVLPETHSEEEKKESRSRDTKVRQLISMLIVARAEALDSRSISRGIGVSREALVDALWPDSDSVSGTNALYTTIKRARSYLGDPNAIVLTDGAYCLSSLIATDCEQVLWHYSEARQARKRNALFSITFHYEQILKRYERGVFMEGLYGSWLEAIRNRLATIHRTAAVRLIQTNLDRGLFDRVEDICQALLAIDELDEEALRGLLVVSAKRRQTSRVFSLYDDFARKLRSEFQSEPSKELRDLYFSLTEVGN